MTKDIIHGWYLCTMKICMSILPAGTATKNWLMPDFLPQAGLPRTWD